MTVKSIKSKIQISSEELRRIEMLDRAAHYRRECARIQDMSDSLRMHAIRAFNEEIEQEQVADALRRSGMVVR